MKNPTIVHSNGTYYACYNDKHGYVLVLKYSTLYAAEFFFRNVKHISHVRID